MFRHSLYEWQVYGPSTKNQHMRISSRLNRDDEGKGMNLTSHVTHVVDNSSYLVLRLNVYF